MKTLLLTSLLLMGSLAALAGNTPVTGAGLNIVGVGAPVGSCSQGDLYTDSATNNLYYCKVGVWTQVSGSGGGGSATFNANSIQYATSTSAARAATSTDIIGLFSSCTGTLYLGADGTCHASGSGTVTNTLGALTDTFIMVGNGSNDATVDGVATLDGNGGAVFASIKTPSNGTNPGLAEWGGNTTPPSLDTNSVGIAGPNVASFTSYQFQLPSTAPTTGQCLIVGTVAGTVVPITGATCPGGGGGGSGTVNSGTTDQLAYYPSPGGTTVAGTTALPNGITATSYLERDLPVAVAQGVNGCSLGGAFPAANAPVCTLTAGTSTTIQSASAEFTGTTPYMEYQFQLPANLITLQINQINFGFYAATDTSSSHVVVWNVKYICVSSGAPHSGTLASAGTVSTTLDGTAGHFLSGELGPTIASCNANDKLQLRIGLDAGTTATGAIELETLKVLMQERSTQ